VLKVLERMTEDCSKPPVLSGGEAMLAEFQPRSRMQVAEIADGPLVVYDG